MKLVQIIDNYSFTTKNVIGQGSYGFVYQGVHLNTNEKVAIKVVKKSQLSEDSYLKKALQNEVGILKLTKSPNIVQFIDLLQDAQHYYIIQEYCEGGDLKSHLQTNQISEQKAISIMKDIITGYEILVKNGIVHRDIKPANVLISNGIYKLADFGFAKQFQNIQMLKSYVGTPLYMSPQVIGNEPYTNKCDIWSLGIMFYQMLYGQLPGKVILCRNTIGDFQKQILKFPNYPIISIQSKTFIQNCLAIEEKDRIDWSGVFVSKLFQERKIETYDKAETKELIEDLRITLGAQSRAKIQNFLRIRKYRRLSLGELETYLKQYFQNIQRRECEMIFDYFNKENDGFISTSELVTTMVNEELSPTFKPDSFSFKQSSPSHRNEKLNMQQSTSSNVQLRGDDILEIEKSMLQKLLEQIRNKYRSKQQQFKIQEYQDHKSETISEDQLQKIIEYVLGKKIAEFEVALLLKSFSKNEKDSLSLSQLSQILIDESEVQDSDEYGVSKIQSSPDGPGKKLENKFQQHKINY